VLYELIINYNAARHESYKLLKKMHKTLVLLTTIESM